MKLPSHTTVIAYLALFVALGGSAYAAMQLPKNSVGTKQIKPNAVTTAKIKNGAVTGTKIAADTVTGANVDESTLGRVPSAASATSAGHATSATSATNATHASNAAHAANAANAGHAATAGTANTLGGVPASGFLKTGDVQFGTGALNVCFAQQLVEIPSWFRITTVGNCQNEFKVRITNLSSENWLFISEGASSSIATGNSIEPSYPGFVVDLFAISEGNQGRHALIDCAYQASTTPARISCSTRIPPAA